MRIPFSLSDFLGVFARYNMAVWPMQVVLYAAAAVVIACALKPGAGRARIAGLVLAGMWAWSGMVYHVLFFARVNPTAYGFGALFAAQAALLARAALRGTLRPALHADAAGVVGGVVAAYALVVYPLLVSASGHPYPAAPTFGAPCPLTLFTLGVFAWADARLPRSLLAVPVFWAAIGTGAATGLGMTADLALVPAAIVGAALVLARHDRAAVTPAPSPAAG